MKICKRGSRDWIQICNGSGDVRSCSWTHNNVIGTLLEDDIETILNSEKAQAFYKTTVENGTFIHCQVDNCPYMANGRMDEVLVDIKDDQIYPSTIWLAYEGACNYHCTCCTSYENMLDAKEHDYSKEYEEIANKLEKVLPYVKEISANGRGELFCSRYIMKLLSEWKPVAPAEEITVLLETNGSLFNETNWKKIENLGQYNLKVAVTVMSFREKDYQYLSGTIMPIDNLIQNLHFIKKLREKNIINELEIATVMQEYNFREMPEFTKRALDEFGADVVRIRPIFPGGRLDESAQWFADVRNPFHPYFAEYKKVMEAPVFKDPKVLLWSGELNAKAMPHPWEKEKHDKEVLNQLIFKQEDLVNEIKTAMEQAGVSKIAVYGLGSFGKVFVELYENKVPIGNIYDKEPIGDVYHGIPVHSSCDASLKSEKIIILTQRANMAEEIKNDLMKMNPDAIYIKLDS